MNKVQSDKKPLREESKAKEAVSRIAGSLALSGSIVSLKQKVLMLDIVQGRVNADEAIREILERKGIK